MSGSRLWLLLLMLIALTACPERVRMDVRSEVRVDASFEPE